MTIARAVAQTLDRARALALRLPAGTAAAVAAAMFASTLPNRPVLDDGWAVLDNPLVRTLDVRRIFGAEYGYAGGSTLAGPYRPVATLTWALGYALHGRAPRGFHVVNVLLHALATALVALLARRLVAAVAPERAAAGALGAGLLFAVHPAHVEAIAPLVARADLLAAALGLAALLAALSPRPRWRLPAAFAALATAVLSKENAAAVPLLYALVALLVPAAAGLRTRPGLARPESRRALLQASLAAGALALAVLPYFVLRPAGRLVPPEARWFGTYPPAVVWSTMTRAIAEYWRILVLPGPLMTDFGYAARIPFTLRFGVESAAATAIWGAVLAAGIASARRAPLRALAILWVFAGLLPVLNVIPIGVLMAERFLYLPSVGLCAWAGQLPSALASRLRAPGPRRAVLAASALAIALLAARSVARSAEWRDPAALFEAELRHAPLEPVVNNNLAVEYTAAGDPRRALERLDVAIRSAPFYWRAHVNRGIALQRLGDLESALGALHWASVIAPREASPHFFAGVALGDRGVYERALAELEIAERLAPEDARTVLYAGRYLAGLGRVAEAREKLRRAAALDPRDPEPARLLAEIGAR